LIEGSSLEYERGALDGLGHLCQHHVAVVALLHVLGDIEIVLRESKEFNSLYFHGAV
jgi:hypothetical protein